MNRLAGAVEKNKKEQAAIQRRRSVASPSAFLRRGTLRKARASTKTAKQLANQDVSTENTLASPRDYTKLTLALVKEEPSTLHYRRDRQAGFDGTSNIQTER